MRLIFVVGLMMLFAMFLIGVGDPQAFHSGGCAACQGCHTMHNSQEGAPMSSVLPQNQTGPYLLRSTDQSSVCLNCHENRGDTGPTGYHISTNVGDMPAGTAPLQRTPGGDFGWLKKTYVFTVDSLPVTNAGERHGHNVIAADYEYVGDNKQSVAPGGAYPSANLHCSSCHDPHGKYRRLADGTIATTGVPIVSSGSYDNSPDPVSKKSAVGVYRLLGGLGYQPVSLSGSFAFTYTVPAAVAPSDYNRSEASTQTRVAYGQGMSEWCANCHTNMRGTTFIAGRGGLVHPAGNNAKLTGAIAANYVAYVKSGDMSNADATRAYNSLVPFEIGSGDHTNHLKPLARSDDTALNGPDTTSNVSCLSCHRAHASGFESMLRYSVANEFITVSDEGGNSVYGDPNVNAGVARGMSAKEQEAAYYDRPATKFAPFQRQLCNKCHAKD